MAHQADGVLQLEFHFDVLAVSFHGLDTDVKVFGDLAGFAALADELKNFKLAITQPGQRRVAVARPPAGKAL